MVSSNWPILSDLNALGLQDPHHAQAPKALRLFPTWEICRYMIPVAPAHLRRVLRDNPDIPQGIHEGGGTARWFTLPQIMQLRQFFVRTGRGTRAYLPYRPQGLPAQAIAVAGSGTGPDKTITSLHLATRAALDGYRVLVIDLDPDGGLSAALPAPSAERPPGITNLFARHYAEHLQAENRARLGRGADPLSVSEALADPLSQSVQDLVRPSLWHRLDVIPSDLGLWDVGLQMAAWSQTAPGWRSWDALQNRLQNDGLLDRYDLIFIDTPPLLDAVALAAMNLANLVVLCASATPQETASAQQKLSLLAHRLNALETKLNASARSLGEKAVTLGQAQCQVLLNNTDPANGAQTNQIRSGLGALAGLTPLPYEPLFATSGGFFALEPRQLPRETYVSARLHLETLWAEVSQKIRSGWKASS